MWFGRISVVTFAIALSLSNVGLADEKKPGEHRFELKTSYEPHCLPKQDSQPGTGTLIAMGLPMAIGQYFTGVGVHELSHAVPVLLYGGKITEFSIFPSMGDDGAIQLGHVGWQGGLPKDQQAVILLAPKITNLAIMGTYSLLLETDNLPKSKYAHLPLLVVTTGAWFDFVKHLPATNPGNDMVQVYNIWGADTESKRLPYRLIHGGLALAGAVEIGRGFYKLFKNEEPASNQKKTQPKAMTALPVVTPGFVGLQGTF